MKTVVRRWFAVAGATLLAACAGPNVPTRPVILWPENPPASSAAAAPALAPAVAVALPSAPAPLPHPDELVGMALEEVESRLGAANLVRRERDAQVWLYRGGVCSLHVYFYGDGDVPARAAYVDARADGAAVGPEVCYADFLAAKSSGDAVD